MQSISMLDLKGEYRLFREDIRVAVDAVLESQHFIGGPAIGELETALAAYANAKHAVAISNGTDALLCSLMALDIKHGDEVILPSFTFFATAGTVARHGAKPVFVDIHPRTFNIDPSAVERAITSRTKAVIPVHLFGQCADMDAINGIARRHKVKVVEDAAQAIGAKYKGRSAGTLGDLASLSFYPTKNLGGFGEGGMIFTNNDPLGTICRQLRNHGESQRYHHDRVGGNFRLDTMKAAILLVKLRKLGEFTSRRRHNAAMYDRLLSGSAVTTPMIAEGNEHVYHQYSILSDRRDALAAYLRDRGIGSAIYYPVPLHLQKCFAHLGYEPGSLPVTEQTTARILSLPIHPMLTDQDITSVASVVAEFCAKQPLAYDKSAIDNRQSA